MSLRCEGRRLELKGARDTVLGLILLLANTGLVRLEPRGVFGGNELALKRGLVKRVLELGLHIWWVLKSVFRLSCGGGACYDGGASCHHSWKHLQL